MTVHEAFLYFVLAPGVVIVAVALGIGWLREKARIRRDRKALAGLGGSTVKICECGRTETAKGLCQHYTPEHMCIRLRDHDGDHILVDRTTTGEQRFHQIAAQFPVTFQDDGGFVVGRRGENSGEMPRHNHVTRWIAPRGQCPACDKSRDAWEQAEREGR